MLEVEESAYVVFCINAVDVVRLPEDQGLEVKQLEYAPAFEIDLAWPTDVKFFHGTGALLPQSVGDVVCQFLAVGYVQALKSAFRVPYHLAH